MAGSAETQPVHGGWCPSPGLGSAPLRLPPSGLFSGDKNQPRRSAPAQEVCSRRLISHLPPLSLQVGEVTAQEGGTEELPAPATLLLAALSACGWTHQHSSCRDESQRASLVCLASTTLQQAVCKKKKTTTNPTVNPVFVPVPYPSSSTVWGSPEADAAPSTRTGSPGAAGTQHNVLLRLVPRSQACQDISNVP